MFKSLNPKEIVQSYGYPYEIDNKSKFYGDRFSLVAFIKDSDGNVIENNMPDKSHITRILCDYVNEDIILTTTPTIQGHDDEIMSVIVYGIPYYVPTHSIYQPTATMGRIPSGQLSSERYSIEFSIEYLFCIYGEFNRACVVEFTRLNTHNIKARNPQLQEKDIISAITFTCDNHLTLIELQTIFFDNMLINLFTDKNGKVEFYDELGNVSLTSSKEITASKLISCRLLDVVVKDNTADEE